MRVFWYVFVCAFLASALAETFLPFRPLPSSTPRRWVSNSILLAASNVVVWCAFQFTGIGLALTVRAASYGLLNRVVLPYAARFAIGFAAVDLTAYASHRLFHALAPLWRVHSVHHSETDLDLTTGFRFHPAEALFSQGMLLAVIALLGLPPAAVAFAGLAIVVQDFFEHANVRIAERADRFLRLVIITPAMHRVHHSQEIPEQNTNFGTILSMWDRLFGTYNPMFSGGSVPGPCGLAEIPDGSKLSPAGLLFLPFRRSPKRSSYDGNGQKAGLLE